MLSKQLFDTANKQNTKVVRIYVMQDMKSTLLIGCFIFDSKSILRRYIIAPNMISWGAIVYPGLLSNLRQTNTT